MTDQPRENAPLTKLPRAFILQRDKDITGVSGTGVVAWGVEYPDGVCALRWTGQWPTSVVFHDRGMEGVNAVHGHDGATRVVYVDENNEFEKVLELFEAASDALPYLTTQSRIDRLAKALTAFSVQEK